MYLPGEGHPRVFRPQEGDVVTPFGTPVRTTTLKWYKLEFHTLPRGRGGTDCDIVYSFYGTNASTKWQELDSPGASHEQNDIDIYYLHWDDIGDFLGWDIYMRRRGSDPPWTYKVWIDEWDGSNWKNLFHTERTSYDHASGFPDRFGPAWSVHIGHDGDRQEAPCTEPGEPTPFDRFEHRPFDS